MHELAQALLGHELGVQQITHPRGDAWSVLDRGGDAVRESGHGHGRAGAAEAAVGTVFGDLEGVRLRAWLRPLLVGLSLWLGIFGGSWATMHWLSGSIQSNIETAGPSNSASSRHARRWPGSRRELGGLRSGRSRASASWCCRRARWTVRLGPCAVGLP